MKVLGYVMANDNFPLLGLSIVHALEHAVDHVLVVSHNQSDSTRTDLKKLRIALKRRITIYDLKGPYFQESTSHISLALTDLKEFDWVYIFDCDEFSIVKSKKLFKKNLESIPENIDALRYSIEQYIAPNDMDENNINDYLRIDVKSVPNIFYKFDDRILFDELLHQNINFFDIPFPSKIIFRAKYFEKIGPGAHNVNLNKINELILNSSTFHVAHIPMISLGKLMNRGNHGKLLIEQKYPLWHGWQNQLIYLIDKNKKLLNFWKMHSVPKKIKDKQMPFAYIIDKSFNFKFKKTLSKFNKFIINEIKINNTCNPELTDLVRIYEKYKKKYKSLENKIDELSVINRNLTNEIKTIKNSKLY